MAIKISILEVVKEKIAYTKAGDTFSIEYPKKDLAMKTFVEAMKNVSKENPVDAADFHQKLKVKLSETWNQ